jgi:hypothetical protein
MLRRTLVSTFALAIGAAALLATGALGPADAEAGARWKLDFKPGTFANVVAGSGKTKRAKYYLPYTVTNNSGEARDVRLRLECKTETGKTNGDHHDASVFDALKKEWKKTEILSTSELRKSKLENEESFEAVAHFGSLDPAADELTVRVYGLWDPVVRDRKGRLWTEKRVLVLKFSRPGDEFRRHEDKITLVSTTEEVEGEVVEIKRARDDSSN